MFSILVVSCDNYSDLWTPFFQLFRRFWPDCPFKLYLLTNLKQTEIPGVNNLRIGNDVSWSDNVIAALSRIPEKYVMLYIEDLFLYDYVDQKKVENIFHWISRADVNCVRLSAVPKPDKAYNYLVGKVSKGTIYRASTVMSVWQKSVLLDLLKPGESAWHFEIYGTVRSDSYSGFYATYEDVFPVLNTVVKGKWQRKALRKMQELGVTFDIANRKILTPAESFVFWARQLRSSMLNFFPAKSRRWIKDFVLRGEYNYELSLKHRDATQEAFRSRG